jgi:hypothetical protein
MTLRGLVLAAALLGAPGLAAADEPTGCNAFRWSIESDRAELNAATKSVVAIGGALRYSSAQTLKLAPFADAALPRAPERAPKATPSFAGHFTLAAPAKPGLYRVTLASDAWIDVIDNGVFLHPKAFSGALGCDGARKSVKFDLPGRPLDVQLSNVRNADIAVIVTPDE